MAKIFKKLVIVESPAKARKIGEYLGDGFIVEASVGHIRDLPQRAADIPKEVKNTVIVVNKNHDEIKRSIKIWEENKLFKTKIYFAVQSAPKGTSDALLSAKPLIDKLKANNVLILSADAPLITESNLSKLIKNCPSLGISEVVDPRGYGRVFIEKSGFNLVSIVEDQDATKAQYVHKVINSGFYALSWKTLLPFLKLVKNTNKQKELYLTDAINSLAKGLKIKSIRFGLEEISGLNTIPILVYFEVIGS